MILRTQKGTIILTTTHMLVLASFLSCCLFSCDDRIPEPSKLGNSPTKPSLVAKLAHPGCGVLQHGKIETQTPWEDPKSRTPNSGLQYSRVQMIEP